MKKLLLPFAALAMCASAVLPVLSHAAAPDKAAQIAKLDGYVWEDTSNDNKLSFLFGLENGIAVEYALGMEQAKRNGSSPLWTISGFPPLNGAGSSFLKTFPDRPLSTVSTPSIADIPVSVIGTSLTLSGRN